MMNIVWNSEFIGNVGFSVTPGDYDGVPPFGRYWFDAPPKKIHGDREAIAAYLIFGSYMSGQVELPHKFSPAVDSALRAMQPSVPVTFTPVEYYPKALPIGSRVMDLSWTGMENRMADVDSDDAAYLRIERSDQAAGSLRTLRGLTVASNAWIHSRSSVKPLTQTFPFIAAAVLFAEDLDADIIRLSGDYDRTSNEWRQLGTLLASARLGLELRTQ